MNQSTKRQLQKNIFPIIETSTKGRSPEEIVLFFWILPKLPPPPFPLIWTSCTTFF